MSAPARKHQCGGSLSASGSRDMRPKAQSTSGRRLRWGKSTDADGDGDVRPTFGRLSFAPDPPLTESSAVFDRWREKPVVVAQCPVESARLSGVRSCSCVPRHETDGKARRSPRGGLAIFVTELRPSP